MNSLVVLLSVVVLASAKPSQLVNDFVVLGKSGFAAESAGFSQQSRIDIKSSPAVISSVAVAPFSRTIIAEPALFSVPAAIATSAYAAPAAVSHQSRLDIKSSPAVVSTTYVEPIARTVIAQPSFYAAPGVIATSAAYAAPAAVSHQSRLDIKSSPAVVSTAAVAPIARTVVAAPATFAATGAVVAPAAFSTQSRLDIKSSPAIVATAPLTRTVIAEPTLISAPAAIAAPAAFSEQSRIDIKSSPAVASTVVSGGALAYSAPFAAAVDQNIFRTAAFAPGFASSTLVKSFAPAFPLDTPEVVAARAAHFEAKALADAHLIRKRSAPLIAAAPLLSTRFTSPIISTYAASPIISTYATAPFGYSAPLLTKAYGVHPW